MILQRSSRHVVAYKPSGLVCHHSSGWAGSRSKHKQGEVLELPMLERVRDVLHDVKRMMVGMLAEEEREVDGGDNGIIPMRRVNLIHRLDTGALGALLFAYADDDVGGNSVLDDGKGWQEEQGHYHGID
jgi:hypothetical protein